MLAVLSGGGTAGHINPALALAEQLAERGVEVRYAGTPGGVEARLVPAAGIPFTAFEAQGFDRAHPATLVKGVAKILRSTRQAKRWFAEVKPDVVVGFGGYVSIPVARAAESMGIPVLVHEQNSVMGMANRYISKRAEKVCLTYGSTQGVDVDGSRIVVTGNPVRASVVQSSRSEGRALLGVPEDATMLLVFGGSLGARSINEAVVAHKDELLSRPNLHIVHITGPKEYEAVCEALALTEEEAKRWTVMGYQDAMGPTLAATDAILSRAGATSLAEIAALAIPALLVPFPHATADHQTTNAQAYVADGCASLVPDGELGTQAFADKLFALVDDPAVRAAMKAAAQKRESADAARLLADVVMAAGGPLPHEVQ